MTAQDNKKKVNLETPMPNTRECRMNLSMAYFRRQDGGFKEPVPLALQSDQIACSTETTDLDPDGS